MSSVRKFLVVLAITAAPFGYAKDLNLGQIIDGKEQAKISIRFSPAGGAVVRYRTDSSEIMCSQYRRDLCGLENKVKLIEAKFEANQMDYRSPELAIFDLSSVLNNSVKAILNDGKEVVLPSVWGKIGISTETSMDWVSTGGFAPKTTTKLYITIWGHRADGLDPIVESEPSSPFLTLLEYKEVKDSLF